MDGEPLERLMDPTRPMPSLLLALLKVSDSGGLATIGIVTGDSALAMFEIN
jgi:hypothetical protein